MGTGRDKTLAIGLLGELELRVGGRVLALPASKKSRALLGYLVATGRPHLRERLCDLLFQGPDDPRAALRWSLTKIRALLDAGSVTRLAADRERVAFEATGIACDLVDVRSLLAKGVEATETEVLRAAAARFRGELLESLELPDCYRYHEWCTCEREAVRAMRVGVLAALTERLAGQPEEALVYARQRVAVDPLSEAAHVAVVSLLTDLGKRREALQQVDACKRILTNELGTKPSAALLAASVRADAVSKSAEPPAPAAKPAAASTRPAPVTATKPSALVGRDAEQATCVKAVERALAREGDRVLLVLGDPGMGKSRLLDAVAEQVLLHGGTVLRGRAYEAERVRPYGPWTDALRTMDRGALAPFAADLAPLLPELGDGKGIDRERLFEAVVRLLASLAPLACVLLDDLQWSDEASAALLHYAMRALAGAPVLFACAARPEELSDNPPAERLVRTLQREGRVLEIELAPLSGGAIATLARSANAGADVQRIAKESAGNPLFVLELARAFASGGDERTSDTLSGLIADRLERLDGAARELVPWAAAIGRTFAIDTLERATELPAMELLGALEELERRGVLRATSTASGPAYDFVHDLVRASAYRGLSEPRRRIVHRRIALVLESLAQADGALYGDVAQHAAIAGDNELAARAYVAAGQRCLRVFANDEAARLAEAGGPHAAHLPRESRIRNQLALAKIKAISGRWVQRAGELDAELSRAIAEAEGAGMHAEAADGFDSWSLLHYERGDVRAAHEVTLRAVETLGVADPVTAARQHAYTARCLTMIEREVGRASSLLAEAEATLQARGIEDSTAVGARGLLLSFEGDHDGACRALERAVALAHAAEDRWLECESLIRLVQEEIEARRPSEALARCRELAPVAAKMGEGSEAVVAEALEAVARLMACVPGARDHVERSIARLRELDAKGMLAYVLNSVAELHLDAHRVDEAQVAAEEALRASSTVDRRTEIVLARAALARVALARGARQAAEEHLRDCQDDHAKPFAISARARRALDELADRLAEEVPIPAP
jgi:DNA-binding SARP family transcriptional activator/tetratricopeptide (TPR) repeat protein